MKESMATLLDCIIDMARELPPETVEALAAEVSKLSSSSQAGSLSSWGAAGKSKTFVSSLVKCWATAPDYAPNDVATALLAANRAAKRYADSQKIDLIWTGPKSKVMPVRRIDQALYELVNGASKTLLIVSYVAYKVEKLIEVLSKAVERGVDVKLILEMDENAGGKVTVDAIAAMKKAVKGAHVYYWSLDQRKKDEHGHYGALHAKCAVADSEVALISSANLTGYAMELNLELGILIRGGKMPQNLHAHFDELMAQKVLKEA